MPKVPAQYLEARKNEVLEAAHACFLRRGFHQTTMQDICKEASLSPGAVYRYFRSKEDIIRESIDRTTGEWTKLIADIRSEAPSPDQALETIGRYFFGSFKEPDFEQSARADVECWPEVLRDERILRAMRRQMAAVRSSFVELFEQAQAEGHLGGAQGDKPEHLYNLMAAAYVGLRLNALLEPEAVDPESVFQVLLQLLRRPEPAPGPAPAAERGG